MRNVIRQNTNEIQNVRPSALRLKRHSNFCVSQETASIIFEASKYYCVKKHMPLRRSEILQAPLIFQSL